MYKLLKNSYTNEVNGVQKQEDNCLISIPFAPDNTDYQAYLEWMSEGNTPEPAETE